MSIVVARVPPDHQQVVAHSTAILGRANHGSPGGASPWSSTARLGVSDKAVEGTGPTGRGTTARPPGMMAVAKHAGVSHQTVSRVVNSPDSVRPQTRERVLAAMAELGFRRNLAARALVTQLSGLVGIVWTGSGHFGPGSTVASFEVAARAAGYSALVTAVSDRDEEDVAAVFSAFRDRGVEALQS